MTFKLNEDQNALIRAHLQDPSTQRDEFGGFMKLDKIREMTRGISLLAVDDDVKILEAQLRCTCSTTESSRIIRQLLEKAGTNCSLNNADPYGDGDQSLIKTGEGEAQILRNLFASGGDLAHWIMRYPSGMPSFVFNCIKGDSQAVEQELKATQTFEERRKLMELRTTSMRLSALLMTIAASKCTSIVNFYTALNVNQMKHTEVLRILLSYGARPNSKDVTGKTGMVALV